MSRINVANCRNCGAEFAPPVFGESTDLCPNCREQAAQAQPPRRAKPAFSALVGMFPVTSTLIALNVLVWVWMVAKGVSPAQPTTAQLLAWGADFGPKTLGGEWWRTVASCFVHAGFIHLAFNMWCLWSLGVFVERFLGRATFAVAYMLAGIGGAVASVWWHPLVVGVGASGAIFGAAGMLVAILRSGQLQMPAEYLKRHSKSILLFIGYNLFFGFINPHIDNAAHLGGLATGLLLGALLPVAGPQDKQPKRVAAFVVTAALLFASFAQARTSRQGVLALVAGEQALDAKHYEQAEAQFRQSLRSDPSLAEAHLGLGIALLNEKKYDPAISELQGVIRQVPDDPDAHFHLGLAYLETNKPADAEKEFLRVTQLAPKVYAAWFNLALARAQQEKLDTAAAAIDEALKIEPKNAAALKLRDEIRNEGPQE